MTDKKSLGLDDAYAVKTPDDNRELYRAWAATYDSDFAAARGYQYPLRIADIFVRHANPSDTPVLDVGAGTGLVADALHRNPDLAPAVVVDGIDISPEMLAVSRSKNVYRQLHEADLTGPLDLPDAHYGAVVSAGTFTHGHVGPVALAELLRVCRPGGLFVLGVNGEAFDQYHFGSAFAALQADKRITAIEFNPVKYFDRAVDGHDDDSGYAVIYRKA